MPFVPDFNVTQTPASPSQIVVTDMSTGSDPAITQKRIYVQDINGAYLVPAGTTTNYVTWTTGQTKTLDILSTDQAVNVKVEWLDAFAYVLYQSNANYCFSQYNQQYFYYLVQVQSQTYNIIQDNRYWQNMATYWANIIGAIKAVELGNDIFGSQVSLNRATFMQNNAQNFF